MNKFLKNITLFSLILLIININLITLGNKLYFNKYKKYSLKFNSYLMADSHGLPLKNLTEKYKVYNFSAESDSYLDMERKLKFLLNKTKIKVLYISVDDHTLSPYREKMNNSDRSNYFLISNNYSNYYKYFLQNYIINNIIFFKPKITLILKNYFYKKINFFLSQDNTIKTDNQTLWSKKKVWNKIKSIKSRYKTQFAYKKKSKKLTKSLHNIIHMCKKNKIKLIGIKFPLSYEYIKFLKNKSYGADKIFIKNGITIFDFKNKFINNSNYFYDQDHLNEKGALKFVKLLFN